MTRRADIAIIGAGLGGLTAALALLAAGFRVRVYEQAPILAEVGAGITLSTGAGKALAAYGLGPALLAASLPIPNIAFVHHQTGALLAGVLHTTPPPDSGFATARHIHRADLHHILLRAVLAHDPDAVVTGRRLAGFTANAGGVRASFADGTAAEADALIGADGARSAVRHHLFGDGAPEFAGQIAYRCLIPREVAQPFLGGGNAVVSIGRARIFNRYVIRGGGLVNVIGIARSDHWAAEGWSIPADRQEFAAAFAGFHADVIGLIGRAPPQSLIKWGLFVRPPLARWSSGRVLLIGDAAHPLLPFLGLGAATAIEDGIVLARALALNADFVAAFSIFQRARQDRVEAVRTQSIRQGEIIQASDPGRAELAQSPSQRTDLFDYDPCAAPLIPEST
jgi:salicylate hydroxylase